MEKITNKEKAREICGCDNNCHYNFKGLWCLKNTEILCCLKPCLKNTLQAMQWKDEQHKDIEEGLREIINALDAKLQKANESGMYYFNQCNIQKQKLIDKACEWLERNDSYAVPTNVQVDRLRAFLKGEDSDYEKQYQEYKRKEREL